MHRFFRQSIISTLAVLVSFACYVWMVNINSTNMNTRQKILKAVYPLFTGAQKLFGGHVQALRPAQLKQPLVSLYALSVLMNDGKERSLRDFKGKKLLFVNTASDCGYTAQYDGLQKLSEAYPDRLVVIGFPANDFKEQEKGDDATIASFCRVNFGVRFPLASKSSVVKGPAQHPVFRWLSDASQNGWNDRQPAWNFSKYLVDEEGRLIGVFDPAVDPLGKEIAGALQ
jgi:glutathione peroxidase